jgi:tetratricopeptide (TPR) repeat protein
MEGTTEPAAYIGLANVYTSADKNEIASYYFNEAVKANPYYSKGVELRDNFKKQTGLDVRVFPSELNVNTAELNEPGRDFNFYYDKGTAYGKTGDYRNAALYLERAVAMNPSSLDALNNLSVAYGMAQEYNKSIEVLKKVTAQYPTNQLAWKNLATIYEHIGEKEKAQECRDKMNALSGQ